MRERAVVATVRYRHEAEIVRGALEAGGIRAFVESDDFGGENPALGVVRGVRVLVGPGDLEAARELIAEAGLGDDDVPPDADEPA